MTQVFLRDRQQNDLLTRENGLLWNTGNYFFLDAVERQVQTDQIIYGVTHHTEADTLVLSMSNFISPVSDMGEYADFIERHNFEKVVMIGCGAQSHSFDEVVQLQEGTVRYLHTIAERCVTIGVRGEYTADVLRRYGITNSRPVGCPTAFWSGRADFSLPEPNLEPERIAVNLTPAGYYRDIISAFVYQAVAAGGQYITQDEHFVAAVGGRADEDRKFASQYYGSQFADTGRLLRWFESEKHFFDIPDWIDHMKTYDFVVGTRFHGNMTAIQAGVPALNIAHDTRTRELCNFLNLPYINITTYRGEPLGELARYADYSLFNATYRDRFRNYVEFLNENGIEHVLNDDAGAASRLGPEYDHVERMSARLGREILALGGANEVQRCLTAERFTPIRSEEDRMLATDGLLDVPGDGDSGPVDSASGATVTSSQGSGSEASTADPIGLPGQRLIRVSNRRICAAVRLARRVAGRIVSKVRVER